MSATIYRALTASINLLGSGFRVQSYSQDARYQGITVTIYYPLHPLFGKQVKVTRDFGDVRGGHWEIVIGNDRQSIPKWMTDEASCKLLDFGETPRSCIAALRHLRDFLLGLTCADRKAMFSRSKKLPSTGEPHDDTEQSATSGPVRSQASGVRTDTRAGETSVGSRLGTTAKRRAHFNDKSRNQEGPQC